MGERVWVVNKGGNVVCMPLKHWEDGFVPGADGKPKSLEDGFFRKPGWRLAASWEIENWIAIYGGSNPPSANQPQRYASEIVGIEARLKAEGKDFPPAKRAEIADPSAAAKAKAEERAALLADMRETIKQEILAELVQPSESAAESKAKAK